MRTKNIKLGTGAHLLPFHNPVELAHRVAYLDHLAQGRYMFGIGSGGLLSDHELFDVNFEEGEHHARTREALEIILGIWGNIDGSFDYEGKFWNVHIPNPEDHAYANLRTFLRPLQQPHPPIGVAGASPNSETLKIVGERGYIPMSLGLNAIYVASHWDAVEEGAARAGKKPQAAANGASSATSGSPTPTRKPAKAHSTACSAGHGATTSTPSSPSARTPSSTT